MPTPPAQPGSPLRRWGPDNPHPLSTMKTELVWEGKYDEWGNRREVDIAGCAMPMQRIETIDQPRSEAAAAGTLALFEKKTTRLDDFRNRLIWGDNKLVMASLLAEFKGKIDLIYIDPPFDVGADFTMEVPIGEEESDTIKKDQSAIEMVAYRDMWGMGTDSYIHTMYERFELLKSLLSESGAVMVHCDWRVGHYLRSVLDEVFDSGNFRNEIVWSYRSGGASRKMSLPRKHDTIHFYSRSASFLVKGMTERQYLQKPFMGSKIDSEGRFYVDTILRDVVEGAPNVVEADGRITELNCRPVLNLSSERLDYPTQKPEGLLELLMRVGCREGDLVADFFCGSGTTGAVAEKLGRRWIMADLGRFAIHTTRKRLIDVQRTLAAGGGGGKAASDAKPYRAFDVYNLGRYERQWWQAEALKGADEEHRRVVLEFFRAEVLGSPPLGSPPLRGGSGGPAPEGRATQNPLIHGRKGRALCHVDGIDGIFTAVEARAVAQAAAAMGATEVYCLAWDFEMDIRQRMTAIESETGVKLTPVKIPREIMEKNRKGPPPWLEVAVLEAEPVYRKIEGGSSVDIKLTRFLPSLAEVPTKELESIKERAVKSGFDFIDFWAIDFDWHADKPFNHHWQDYRTRKDRSLKTKSEAGHVYAKKGAYTACVKVVDVFGCDTSITVAVRV